MARGRALLFIPPVIFGLLVGLLLAGMYRDDPDGLPSAMVGRAAPPVVVTPLGDGPVLTDEMLRSGGVKLVNFWASWCAPCRVEHPVLQELAAEGVTIYGINYKDDPEKAIGFLQELGNPYAAMGADGSGRMAVNWGVYGVPETYVLTADGTVVLRFAGPITRSILASTIRPALAAAAVGG